MRKVKHGMSHTKVYHTWSRMLSRCRNPKDNNYKNYGARGIFVCERWSDFTNFFSDMGDLPFEEAQLDRIDNEDGYFLENCRWATPSQNCRNKRNNKRFPTQFGKIVQQDFIEKVGWTKNQLRWFLKRYGMAWILENYKSGTLPERINHPIDRNDIVGKIFGKWHVLSFSEYTKKTGHLYLCKCGCGKEKKIPRSNLVLGKSLQCHSCATKEQWEKRRN